MKFIAITIISLLSLGVNAQEEHGSKPSDNSFNFQCKTVEIDNESKTVSYIEDASYKDAIIEVNGAEQIVFDQSKNEITLTGSYNFTIDGSIQYANQGSAPKILRYKIGEDTAYIE